MKRPTLDAKKVAGFVISGALLATQSLFAYQPEKSFWDQRRQVARRTSPSVLASLPLGHRAGDNLAAQFPSPQMVRSSLTPSVVRSLPKSFLKSHADLLTALSPVHGSVRKVSLGKNAGARGPVVIHIQDVHMNAEAQKNIRETVATLLNSGKVGLVALEGSTEDIALQPFVDFPNRKAVELTADYLLRENKISGPIHAALTASGKLPRILGIDDPVHYAANVQAYKDSAPKLDETRRLIKAHQLKIDEQKKSVFSPALLALDETVSGYRADSVSLGDYVGVLVEIVSRKENNYSRHSGMGLAGIQSSSLRNVDKLTQALNTERSLDFKQVEAERSRLIEKLTNFLSTQEINELMAQSVAYRTGELRYGDFYGQLRETCAKKGIRLSDYPAMDEYVRYVLLCDGIDAEKLLNEMSSLEKAAYDALAPTSEEKALAAQSRQAWLTSKLVDFSLTPPEWKEYEGGKGNLEVFFSPLANDGVLASFESFYREAEARDTAMAQNLLAALDLDPKSATFSPPIGLLVTGGFHAEGMADLLTQTGATVISYVPKIEKIDSVQGSTYLSVFTQERTPLERLFEGEKLFLSQHPAPLTLTRTFLPALVAVVAALLGLAVGDSESTVPVIYASLGGLGTLSLLKISQTRATVRIQNGNSATELDVKTEGGVIAQATQSSIQSSKWHSALEFIRSKFSRPQAGNIDPDKPMFVSNPAAVFRSLSLFFGQRMKNKYGQALTKHADLIGIVGLVIEIPILVVISVSTPFWVSTPFLLLFSYFHDFLESQIDDKNPPNLRIRRIVLMLYLLFPFVGFNSIFELAILVQDIYLAHIVLVVPTVHLVFDLVNIPHFINWKIKLMGKKMDKVNEIQAHFPGLEVKGWETTPFQYLEDIQSILQRIPPERISSLKVITLSHLPWFMSFRFGGSFSYDGHLIVRVSPWRGRFRNVFAHEIGHALHHSNPDSLHYIEDLAWEIKDNPTIIDEILSKLIPGYLHTPQQNKSGMFVSAYSLTHSMEHYAELIRVCLLYPQEMNKREELADVKKRLSSYLGVDFNKPVFNDVFETVSINWLRISFLLSLWVHLCFLFPQQGLIFSLLPFIFGFFYSRFNYLFERYFGNVISKSFAKLLINLRSVKFVPAFPDARIKLNNIMKLALYGSIAIILSFIVGLLILIPIPQYQYVRHIGDLSFDTEQVLVFTEGQKYRARYYKQDYRIDRLATNYKDIDGDIEVHRAGERLASFYESFKSLPVQRDLGFADPNELRIATVIQWMIHNHQERLTYVPNPKDAVLNQLGYLSEFVNNIEFRYEYRAKRDGATEANKQPLVIVATIRNTNGSKPVTDSAKPGTSVIVAQSSAKAYLEPTTDLANMGISVANETSPVEKPLGKPQGPSVLVRDPSITPADVDRVKKLFVERTKTLVERDIPRLVMRSHRPTEFEITLFHRFRFVAGLKYNAVETLKGVYAKSDDFFSPLYEVNDSLREIFLKGANIKKPLDPESGRGTSLWGLKFAEWMGSKVDPKQGSERFGAAYKRFAALIEWSFSAKVAFWGFMGTLAFAGTAFGWLMAPVAGLVYGILFFGSHFIPESLAPVTKVKVGVVQALLMGVIYGVLISVTPYLLGAVPLLGIPEFGVLAGGAVWALAGLLHHSFDKENLRKEGQEAAWKLIKQLSHVQGAFEVVMPGIHNGHTEEIVGNGNSLPEWLTKTLSRLKTDKEFRMGFLGVVQTAIAQENVSGSSLNLLSALVMAATGQPIAHVHILGNSQEQELQTLQGLIEREGKTSSGFSVALVVSESQRIKFKTMIDMFEARGGAVFSVDIQDHGWSKEVLVDLDNKMAPFLAKANGIVATVGENVGINRTAVEALNPDSKLRTALMNALTLTEVVETFLRFLRHLASNA